MAAQTVSTTLSLSGAQRFTVALSALLLGVFLVYGAGLANSAVLHDTAHDTRHSYGFPCH
ncbi:CbtB-domain containing protein [Nitratireductor sp. XY-223]|uniref:CbtB domain-containing protein n=1 Tax=Nitratireductor sp. XY-223 TaxID=2561926 RepID=UPI0010AA3168|nr:CbtB-domain containing protein [Nitratireductor sp. XY-223]